jgi:hypothetical protein
MKLLEHVGKEIAKRTDFEPRLNTAARLKSRLASLNDCGIPAGFNGIKVKGLARRSLLPCQPDPRKTVSRYLGRTLSSLYAIHLADR